MPGVVIGKNSIVAAGSIVTKSVPPGSIVAGNPARVISKIKEYKDKNTDLLKCSKVYAKNYTLKGNLSIEDKKKMYKDLDEKMGYIQ